MRDGQPDTLHGRAQGPRDNRRWTNFRTPDTRQAIRHLLAAGLIQDNGVTLTPAKPALDTFALDGGEDVAWTYRRVELANARDSADVW